MLIGTRTPPLLDAMIVVKKENHTQREMGILPVETITEQGESPILNKRTLM